MILIKIFVVCLFAGAWWRSKMSRTVEPSDFFFISFLVIYVPGFLGNPSGNSAYNQLALSPLAAHNAEIGLSLAMVAGTLLLIMRREVERRVPSLSPSPGRQISSRRHASVSIIAILLSVLLVLALAFDASYREYKDYVLQFFSMRLSGKAYRFIRVYWFFDSFVVNSLLERARYTVFPILYVLSISYLVARGRILASILCAALFFLLLPASLSKLPLVIYAGYLLTLCLTRYPKLLTTGWLVVMGCLASVLLIAGLSLLYHFQYAGSVAAGKVFPVDLAFQRLWGEPYSIVVRYYETYPKILPFTGWDGISLFARLAGHDARMPDLEVPNVILGPETGSNPAVFFLAGYAAFAQLGLAVCAFAGFAGLWLIDIIGRKLHFGVVRAAYIAVMGVNILFLNQIALHTALLTYGLGLIPLALLVVDLALRYAEGSATVRAGEK